MSREIMRAAIRYALNGWPVLPIVEGDKMSVGRLVPHGCLDATTDLETIERWWEHGDAPHGVGIATGHGCDVLDVDDVPRFEAWLGEQDRTLGELFTRCAIYARTPRGGWHLYWRPTGRTIAQRQDIGADWRGMGGHVVAPPTPGYRWLGGGSTSLAEAPEWVFPAARPAERVDLSAIDPASPVGALVELSRREPGWRIGQAILTDPDLCWRIGGQRASRAFVEAAWRAEVEALATIDRGRNDALWHAVFTCTRFADVDPRPIVDTLEAVAVMLPHADHPEWGTMDDTTVAKTVGSAVWARALRTAAGQNEEAS